MTDTLRILAHLDDVGATAGSVEAWRALRAAGVVRSASVMVPCAWYRGAVDDYLGDPEQDLGVHVTLTSEWSSYRWRPMIGDAMAQSGGLSDDQGFFHKRPEQVAAQADPRAVRDEMAAQVQRALDDGLLPTHLDCHMGTGYLPEFIEQLWQVGDQFGIPVALCHDMTGLFDIVRTPLQDRGYLAELVQETRNRGGVVFDNFLIGFVPEGRSADDFYGRLASSAGPGLHWFAMHANAPGDFAAIAPHMAWPREQEYALFSSPAGAEMMRRIGARTLTWAEAQSELSYA